MDGRSAMDATGSQPDQQQVGVGVTPKPKDRTVKLWVWNTKWMKVEDRKFVVQEIESLHVDRALVATGMAESRGEAQRLIKAGGVYLRRPDEDKKKITDVRAVLPSGWPHYLQVGNGNWRLGTKATEMTAFEIRQADEKERLAERFKKLNEVMVEPTQYDIERLQDDAELHRKVAGKYRKPHMYPGIMCVMVPLPEQDIEVWSELWAE